MKHPLSTVVPPVGQRLPHALPCLTRTPSAVLTRFVLGWLFLAAAPWALAATAPGAPTAVAATGGNAQAVVSFTMPASDGGAAITGYTATSNPGGLTGTGTGSPLTVTGLTNGTSYTFSVTATNSAGTGAASSASAAVVTGNWAKNFSLSGASTQVNATATDAAGNVYVAGNFSGATLSVGGVTLTRIGMQDAFVAKYSVAGLVVWARNYGGSGGAVADGLSLAVDSTGQVYLGGSFYHANLTTPALTKIGATDAYALKLDTSGAVLWAKNFGGSGASAYGRSIAVDGTGNVYLGGNFFNASLTTPALTKIGSQDVLALKLDASGAITWARNYGGVGAVASGQGIAVDSTGNVYLGGYFYNGSLTSPALTLSGSQDVLALKLDASGATTWARRFGGTLMTYAYCYAVAVDDTGNVYLGGSFSGANLTTPVLTKTGLQDTLVLKLDTSGSTLWARNHGGSGAYAHVRSLTLDGTGNVYLGGHLEGGSLTTPALTKIGTRDALAVKLDASGVLFWAGNYGGSGTSAYGTGIAVDPAGTVYLGGYFNGGNLTTPALTGLGTQDALLLKAASPFPVVAPLAPTSVAAAGGNHHAVVSFTAPTINGGSAITGYTVTSSPGGFTATGPDSPLTVTGLTNGTSYTFTVTATNVAGTSAASSASGATLVGDWAKNFNLSGTNNTVINALTTDRAGNIYVVGRFSPSTLVLGSVTLFKIGDWDTFAAKFDATGTVVWAKNYGGVGASTMGMSIAVDHSGNVYVGGYCYNANLTTPALTVLGIHDAFVLKLDASGATTWARNYGGSGVNMNGLNIAVDGTGNVYLGGYFTGANPTTPALTKIGTQDAYALKLDASGTTVWARNYGGSGASAYSFGLAVDSAGNMYLGGYFTGANLTAPALTKIGTYDVYTLKLDSSGTTTWAKNYGGSGASTFLSSVTVDSADNVYLSGGFTGANLTTPALTKIGTQDALALKLDPSGATTWAKNYGGSGATALGNGLTVDSAGHVYLGGTFTGANLSTPALTKIGSTDLLALKLDASGATTWSARYGGSGATVAGGSLAIDSAGNVYLGGSFSGANLSTPALTKLGTLDALLIKSAAPFPAGAPTAVSAVARNREAVVTFTAPTNNGGAAITGYTVTSSPGGFTGTGTGSPITVTSLTNGTSYTFTVTATNLSGPGATSSASTAVTPVAGTPNAPTSVTAVAGRGQAVVSFTAPVNNGGTTITAYTVTSSPGGVTASGASSPVTVAGLTNGTSYTFTVTATNSAGVGTASSASAAVTPLTVPGAPTAVSALARNREAVVSFTAPASNGGTVITGYVVTSSPGGFTGSGTGSPIAVTGLTNGTSYTFTVAATNAVGTGEASSASAAITPVASTPNAPTAVSAVAGRGQAVVSFTAPVNNGGSTITGYTATSSPGGFTASGAGSPLTVTGLTNGSSYTFTVTATNAVGTSAASSASAAVTPATVPGAPTAVSVVGGNRQAVVSFTAPASTGGAAITGYIVTSSPGGVTASGASSPITVTGLTNGTSYTFTVTAINPAGTGAASTASAAVLLTYTVPGAPTAVSAIGGNARAVVSFTPPASDGGSDITSYTATSSPGSFTGTGTGSPLAVLGLANGTSYTFTVTATNAAGPGAASSASAAALAGDWAKNFGLSGADTRITATAADAAGNVYVAGLLSGATLAVGNVTLTRLGYQDAFVLKFNSAGAVVWAKNYGGSGVETFGQSIKVDSSGNVYLSGNFNGANLTSPALARIGGQDAFVLKLDASGATQWITNFGGSGAFMYGKSLAIDSVGNVYLGGDFGASLTTPALTKIGTSDAFALKLNASGQLNWARNFGGSAANMSGNSIAVDYLGNVYLGGEILAGTVTTPALPKIGTQDAYALKLDAAGATVWARNFGGSGVTTYAPSIVVDDAGNVYLGGNFYGANLTTPALTAIGRQDAFALKLDASGATTWARNYGGSGASATGSYIEVDGTGNVYLSGFFVSANLTAPALTKIGSWDAYALKIGGSGATTWAKNYGGSGASATGQSLALDSTGNVYLGGMFFGANLTTPALTKIGTYDALLIKTTAPLPGELTTPGAPSSVSAVASFAQATVSFTAPASNGGTAITGYTVTSSPGGFTASGAGSPLTVTGLTSGTSYTFTVTATNVVGAGAASSASAAVTPLALTVPGAPTAVAAVGGFGRAVVSFTAPASSGGTAITGYTVTSNPGGFTGTGTGSPITVMGLTNGTSYTFTVIANNSVGVGPISSASAAVIPALTVPDAPTAVVAIGGNARAVVSLAAPASDGGAAITGYTVTSSPGGFTASGTGSPITVTGLTNGTSYTFTVTATNSVGTSAALSASAALIGDWAKNFGLTGSANSMSSCAASALDEAGNVYLTGSFDSATLTVGSVTLTRIGTQDAFVAKYNTSGTVLWARNYGGSGAQAYGRSIAVDSTGNVHLGGIFSNANLTSPVLAMTGGQDAMVLKLDASGATLWAKSYGGSGALAYGESIAVDGTGNVYLGGYFLGASLTTPALTKIGGYDAYALKLDASGETAWARNYGGSGANAYGQSIAVDSTGNVYLGGYFTGANLTAPALTKTGTGDAFALKLDANGATTWARNYGGSGASAYSYGIAVDGTGNVYLGGYFLGASLTTPALTRIGNYDAYALKLDASGATTWARNYGGSGAYVYGKSLTLDSTGSVYLGGYLTSASMTTPALTVIGTRDAFALKITASGATTWAKNYGGSGANTFGQSIAADSTGNVFLGGYFGVANLTAPALTKISTYDALLIKATAPLAGELTAPGAPTAVAAVSGNGQATVSFTAPASNGGTALTGYTVTASPGGATASGTASPLTVTGLTNGTSYTFIVTATNAVASGTASSASTAITPAPIAPGAPTAVAAVGGNSQATVSFTAPASNGGTAITGYTVTASPGGATASGTGSPLTVMGLANSTSYTFSVTATNAAGTGAASSASAAIIPVGAPGAPTAVAAVGGYGEAMVSFTAPASNGGTAVTGYTVTASPGGATASGAASPLTVTGLTNGTGYTFTVTATNAVGTGAVSGASAAVSPGVAMPGAPTAVAAIGGNGQATVSFTAPANSGGTAITGYTVTSSPGGFTASGAASPLTLTGLTNGTSYTFTVTATNAVGPGAASSAAAALTGDWAKNFGLSGSDTYAVATATDAAGNVYLAGYFSGATLSIGSVTLTRIGGQNAFVAKYNAAGSVLWARNFGGSGATVSGQGLAVDGAGNVYVCGYFTGANLTTPALTKIGVNDAFVLKLDASGATTWVRSYGGSGALAYGYGLAVDGTGNVYLSGYLTGANLTTPALTKIGSQDAFALKLDTNGATTWARSFGGTGASAYSHGIAVDGTGNVYLSGEFGTASLTTPALTKIGMQDAFALKLDASGATTWARNYGGSGALAYGYGLAVDGSGNVYLGGHFQNGSLTTPLLTKIGNFDTYALKLDASGATTWAKNYGGSGVAAMGYGLAVDRTGNVYLGGYFQNANLTRPALTRIGTTDAFALKLDASGATTWTRNFGGSGGSAFGRSLAVDSIGNVFLGGYFGSANLTTPALTKIGTQDALLIKVSAPLAGEVTAPGAPTTVAAVGGNGQAVVSFTAPANNGGTAITGYTVTSNPGGFTASGTGSPLTVTGLTNGTSYTFTVTATNAAGTSAASSASAAVTPDVPTAPGAPTAVAAVGGNSQAVVSFTAPASDGHAAITSYTVTSSPGGFTGTGAVSPITVTGLTNGTTYTFSVTATNAAGTSAASIASTAVTLAPIAPGVPTAVAVVGGNGQAVVSFTAPASNGGAAVTGYTVTASPGGATASGAGSPLTVTGLTNGASYTFTVAATNAAGTGAASIASAAVTPAVPTAPGAPTIAAAIGGNGQAVVSFTPPASDGGAVITGYTATSNPGGFTASGTASPLTVTGLTNGTGYTFTVTATNTVGTGAASSASAAALTGDWATNFGLSGGNTDCPATATDAAGNVYLIGSFNSATLSVGSVTLTRIGVKDAYLAKYNAAGLVVWAKNYGGSGATTSGICIKVDGAGNVYLSGTFTVASLTTPALTIIGRTDAFALKLDANGATVWARNYGGSGASVSVRSIDFDGTGNVFLGGYFYNGSLTTPALTKIGAYDAFALKLDASGATVWARNYGGSGSYVSLGSMVVDRMGNVYIGGYFSTASMSTPALTKIGTQDAFALKLDASGATIWARNFGGVGVSATGQAVAVDGSGNVYVGGRFGGANLTTPALTKIGTYDAFAVKLDASGATSWVRSFGGSGVTAFFRGLAVDNEGNVYLGGNFTGASLTTPALTKIGTTDAYALKLDASGATTWARNYGGSGANVTGQGITVDGTGNVYLNGFFDSADLTTPALTKIGTQDALLLKATGPFTIEATAPGAPTIVAAVGGNTQAVVSFTAPVSNGGAVITGYTVTSSPGGFTANGPASPLTVTGLTNGTSYTFTVTATNAVGTGAASIASAAITPVTLPGAPTIVAAVGGNGQAVVSFTAPVSNGGAVITGYTVTSTPGGFTASGTGSPLSVTGLTNGTSYTFTVTATNAAGTGAASGASAAVTPVALAAPTVTTPTSASVATTAASLGGNVMSDGGAAVTARGVVYAPTATNSNPQLGGTGAIDAAGTGTTGVFTVDVTGLAVNTAYTYAAYATNSAGTSYSATGTFTTLPLALAPVIASAVTASGTYGTAITAYAITATNTPASYSATGLPPGLALNTTTGEISGTPSAVTGSPFSVTIGATNAGGTGSATLTFTMNKRALVVSSGFTATPRAYDGTTTAAINAGTLVLLGKVGVDDVTVNTSAATGTFASKNVGSRTAAVSGLTLSGAAAPNYTVSALATPAAAITAMTLTVTGVTAANKTYDGTTTATPNFTSAALVGVVSGDAVTLVSTAATASFADKSVATAKPVTIAGLTLSGTDAANYALTQPATTADITKPALTVTGVTVANKTYDATAAATPSFTGAALTGVFPGDLVTLVSSAGTASFADKSVATGRTATIAGLTLIGNDAANYALTQPTTTADITVKSLTVTGITAANRIYDSTTVAALDTASAALAGVLGTDAVTLVKTAATGAFATKTIGTAKTVQVSGLTLAGGDAPNYTLTQSTATADLTAKELMVMGVTVADKTYDGTTTATPSFTSAALAGVASGDTVTLVSAGGTASFADAGVGATKTVAVTGLALGGADAANYRLTQPTLTGRIDAATINLTLTGLSQTYDGKPKAAGVAFAGTPVTVRLSYGSSEAAPVNAGTYAVSATVTQANYTGSASGTLTIAKAAQTVAFTLPAGATPGAALPLGATASSGLPVTYAVVSGSGTVSGSTLTVASGTITVRATQAGNENYAEASAEATVIAAGKLAQTIALGALTDRSANEAPFALRATASSGLPVSFTVVSGPASLNGGTLTLTSAGGTVTVRATQAGNASYEAAPPVTQSFNVLAVGRQVYFGLTSSQDMIGIDLSPDGKSGTLLCYIGATGEVFIVAFTVNADGSFETDVVSLGAQQVVNAAIDGRAVAGAPARRTFRGRLSAGAITGSIVELGVSFTTSLQPAKGPTAAIAGLYTASASNTTGGGMTASIIGTQGQVFVVTSTPAVTTSGNCTLSPDGSFSLKTAQATISGAVNAETTVLIGTIQVPNQTPVSFAGLAISTAHTDRLINLSSRVRVSGGDNVLITGFAIAGTAPKQVLVRGTGPALTGFGLQGVLANPKISLYRGTELVAENDDWAAAQAADFARLGAFALPAGSKDAALLVTLAPGAYTAIVADGTNAGVALAEIYDASVNPNSEYQRLVNISTRGEVSAGEGALIGGFVVTGNSPKKLLVRGIGPGLTAFGLKSALADPRLRVYRESAILAENDNWSANASEATATTEAAQATGAFALVAGSKDAALILTLAPGAYTAQVTAADGTSTGVALVEIYEMSP